MEFSEGGWLGVIAVAVSAIGGIAAALIGRVRTTKQELDVHEAPALPPAPTAGDGTWTVSREMYEWFQEQMSALHRRVGVLEDSEREQRARGDRLERLLQKALLHIDRQDQRMTANGMDLVPMDPELTAARSE